MNFDEELIKSFSSRIDTRYTRPEADPSYEQETWSPTWKCYCCQDRGVVTPILVRHIQPNFDENKHGIPICQATNCRIRNDLGDAWLGSGNYSFESDICNYLHDFSKKDWQESLLNKHELRKKALEILSNSSIKKMPKGERKLSDIEKINRRLADPILRKETVVDWDKYEAISFDENGLPTGVTYRF